MPTVKTLFLVCAAFSAALSGRAADKPSTAAERFAALFEDDIVARGKGVEVKRSQLDDAYISFKANLAARQQNLPEAERPLREAQLLDRLIITQLLVNRVTDADRKQARDLADKFMSEAKKMAPNEEVFNRQLKALSLTPDHFNQRVMEQALAEAVLEREIKSKLTVTAEELEEFYKNGTDVVVQALTTELGILSKSSASTVRQVTNLKEQIEEVKKNNLARLEQPEKLRVLHLLISTQAREGEQGLSDEQKRNKRQTAAKLRTRALSGEDFNKLIQESSEDPGLKETKGEYTFSRNDNLWPEFKAAAFSLETGKLSDIVTTTYGYHLIKVQERIPAKKSLKDEKLLKELREFLLAQKVQKEMPDYFDKLKREAAIEILDARYRIQVPKTTDPRRPPGG